MEGGDELADDLNGGGAATETEMKEGSNAAYTYNSVAYSFVATFVIGYMSKNVIA